MPHPLFSVVPTQSQTIVTPPGTSFFCTEITVLLNGQQPRVGETGPRIVIEGRSYEEVIALHTAVLSQLIFGWNRPH